MQSCGLSSLKNGNPFFSKPAAFVRQQSLVEPLKIEHEKTALIAFDRSVVCIRLQQKRQQPGTHTRSAHAAHTHANGL